MSAALVGVRLLAAHAFTDYAWQSNEMARWKSPGAAVPTSAGRWWWWLLAHGMINGAGVAWATTSLGLGVAESLVHSLTDYGKCRGWLTPEQDQLVHLCAKGCWTLLAVRGGA